MCSNVLNMITLSTSPSPVPEIDLSLTLLKVIIVDHRSKFAYVNMYLFCSLDLTIVDLTS